MFLTVSVLHREGETDRKLVRNTTTRTFATYSRLNRSPVTPLKQAISLSLKLVPTKKLRRVEELKTESQELELSLVEMLPTTSPVVVLEATTRSIMLEVTTIGRKKTVWARI